VVFLPNFNQNVSYYVSGMGLRRVASALKYFFGPRSESFYDCQGLYGKIVLVAVELSSFFKYLKRFVPMSCVNNTELMLAILDC